jgi:hypothetical protein
MRGAPVRLALLCALLPGPAAFADDPPAIEHHPFPCTVPAKVISLCAGISDDQNVSAARLYFRRAGEDYYSFADMSFRGINYCGTLPAPRAGKLKVIEYYVQAVDDQFQAQRTSTFQLKVVSEGQCEFPPVEKDAARAGAVKVFATHKKQGSKLDDAFERTGVTYVPLGAK